MDEVPNDAVEKADEEDGKKKQKAVARRVLSARQELAVRARGKGIGVVAAAKAVGVSRQTLHRWMAEPAFVAAMNRWRVGVLAMARGQILAGLGDAAETVVKAAREGNVRAAMMLLEKSGAFEEAASVSTETETIARRQELQERAESMSLDKVEASLRDAEALTAAARYQHAPSPPPTPKVDPWADRPEPEKGSYDALLKLLDLPPGFGLEPGETSPGAPAAPTTDPAIGTSSASASPPPPAGGASSMPAAPENSSSSKQASPASHHHGRHAYSPGAREPIDPLDDQFIDIFREDRR
jgi:hypothetical protein